jgi:hypothetical protein
MASSTIRNSIMKLRFFFELGVSLILVVYVAAGD